MQRKKTILIVSHCILNQNTVIEGESRALGAIPSALDWIKEEGVGVLQLPCPEFTFLGINRPPMTYEEYNTEEYRTHCSKILTPIIEQIIEYQKYGYTLTGILAIQSSPSCDPSRGVYMEELKKLFEENEIPLNTQWYLPNHENPIFDGTKHYLKKDS